MSDCLWQLQNVFLAGTNRPRLDHVCAEVLFGTTALLGYSGAGKTSLLNILAGLETGYEGNVTLNLCGDAAGLPVFWVPQDGGLWPQMSCADHLRAVLPDNRSPAWLDSVGPSDSARVIDKILAGFDLSERRQALPMNLSQGEQARLSVARCLAAAPKVLLMDEPLAHVDPIRRPKYWRLIEAYVQAREAALIFSTHQPETAIREAEHVICLDAGRIIHAGDLNNLYVAPPSEEAGAFLGPLNWFDVEAAVTWLDRSTAMALRPEQLNVVVDTAGPFEVLSFRFSGSYSETELATVGGDGTRVTRVFVHRSSESVLQPGQRARLQW